MNNDRYKKIEEQTKEISAKYIERVSNKTAIITVTQVQMFDRGKKATVYISVLPQSSEEMALNFLKRKRAEIRNEVKDKLNIRTIPFIDVEIDTGHKALQTIENLLRKDS